MIEDVTGVVDVTDRFRECVRAERRGADVLILYDLDTHGLGGPRLNLAGQCCRYEVCYRWLRNDRADLCEVLGQEVTLWPRREVRLKKGLFDQFRLFP